MFIWTIGDAIQIILLLLLAMGFLAIWLHRIYYQWRCHHDGNVGETAVCDAICLKCGKNLGFIGTWREKRSTGDSGA